MRGVGASLAVLFTVGGSVCFGATEGAAIRAETPPKIDGKLNEAVWAQAKPVERFTVFESTRRSGLKTRGYVAYDDSHLYLAMDCLDGDPKSIVARVKESGEAVFADDRVEIMVDPGQSKRKYYQFVVAAGGGTFEVARTGGGVYEDDDWQAQWRAATSLNDDGWSVELAIPYYTLQITEAPGPVWGVNFCRGKRSPRELSATADRGIFNDASKFNAVRGINADFSKFQFEVLPETRFSIRNGKPVGLASLAVTNRTGQAARVKIEHRSNNEWRDRTPHSRAVTLQPGGQVSLELEPQRLQPMVIGQADRYMILDPPAREHVTITDAATGEVRTRINVNLPLMYTAIHVRPKRTKGRLVLSVRQNIDQALLSNATFRVNVGKRGSRQPLLSWEAAAKQRQSQVVFEKGLPPGAYLASAALLDQHGRPVVECIRPVTVQPPGVKVLNNFVTELLNATGPAAAATDFTIFNPRDGWIFVRSTAKADQDAVRVVLDGGPTTEAVIVHRPPGRSTVEAKRFLSAGEHRLAVHGGRLGRLIVRTMPEVIYPVGGGAKVPAFGKYDWKFMQNNGYLRNITTIRAGHDYGPREPFALLPQAREWKKAGGRWLFHTGVPFLGTRWKKPKTAEEAYEYWTDDLSFREPALDGHMADEINGGTAEMFQAWAKAVRWFSAEPKFHDKVFVPWVAPIYGSQGGRLFMNVLLGTGRHRYAFKRYLSDQPTLAEAKSYLRARLIDDVQGWTRGIEGGMAGLVVCWGIFTTPNETCNRNPGTNFFVFQDMEFNIVANDPTYRGVGGIQAYGGSYCDPETHRWVNRLIRHYCIEGRTEMLSKDPYELTHLAHPDYPDPTRGWTVVEAEPGTTAVDRLPGYNYLIGAYGEYAPLDRFLKMKRSKKGPNSFSQQIKDLTPGRLYSLKFIVADYNDIKGGVSRKLEPDFRVRLDNVEVLQDLSFDGPFVNNYAHAWGKFDAKNRAHFIYVRRVFRAKAATSRLTVSDWKTEKEPGGPIGQELMFSFIEVQPYIGQ